MPEGRGSWFLEFDRCKPRAALGPADVLAHVDSGEAQLRGAPQRVDGEVLVGIPGRGMRKQLVLRKAL